MGGCRNRETCPVLRLGIGPPSPSLGRMVRGDRCPCLLPGFWMLDIPRGARLTLARHGILDKRRRRLCQRKNLGNLNIVSQDSRPTVNLARPLQKTEPISVKAQRHRRTTRPARAYSEVLAFESDQPQPASRQACTNPAAVLKATEALAILPLSA